MMRYCIIWILFAAVSVFGQRGDKPGELQAPPPARMKIPPAPPLSVEEALKSFRLQSGFSIELVASEPMIEAPVEIEFDERGRMYVLEMRGYMQDVDGKGENERNGRVSLLEDSDGDGRMDKHTVFADELLMPRAIATTRGGLLIAEPPVLWFFRDTDGDGRADHKEVVSRDYGSQANPEHNANGLLWGRDNWIYSANHTVRYRNLGNGWEKQATLFRGQWGITQDDLGRLFFNSNSDQLRGDLVPSDYLIRNEHFNGPYGGNVRLASDQSTFPIRVNPGVNRGYQTGTLRADGTLAKFTGACGPCIYRGELFPEALYGAAFVCEPTANFVRCNLLTERDGVISATNAFPGDEFLASTDERFRPVNISNGPDGALYIVDMYRGVIQHRMYLTTYLRSQALERNLETPINMGRVYRVLPARQNRAARRDLGRMRASALVEQLQSHNGWVRDTAQRLLVERKDFVTIPLLERLALEGTFPAAVHALWVLDGVNGLSAATALRAMEAESPKVRATAVRVSEPLLREDVRLQRRIMDLANDPDAAVQVQVMLTLGEMKSSEALAAMIELLSRKPDNPLLRDAAISGIGGRELDFLAGILAHPEWTKRGLGSEKTIQALSRCVAESRDETRVSALLEIASTSRERWVQNEILDGIATLIPTRPRGGRAAAPNPLRFASEPAALAKLASTNDKGINERLERLEPLLTWPGKGGTGETKVEPLTEMEQKLFEAGRSQYQLICGACHQPNGQGLDGLAPPLVGSEWATGSPERLARIVLQGLRGPLNVKGRVWELEMPPVNILSDEELAGLLTYIRREWGHTASPITPEFMAKVRQETEDRLDAWTEAELLKVE